MKKIHKEIHKIVYYKKKNLNKIFNLLILLALNTEYV